MRVVANRQTSVKYIYRERPAAHDRCRGGDVAVAEFSGGLSPSGTAKIVPIASV